MMGVGRWPGQAICFRARPSCSTAKKAGIPRPAGWDRKFRGDVETIGNQKEANDSYDADLQSQSSSPSNAGRPHQPRAARGREILKDITFIDGDIRDAVTEAARYHDIGKTHRVFQDTMKRE